MWRLIRSWICHNHKIYYTISIGWAFATYNVWWYTIIGYYRQRNHHRSLDWAIEAEAEWDRIKPKEEEYDEEDYGDEGGEGAEAPAAEEGAGGEEGGDEEEDE